MFTRTDIEKYFIAEKQGSFIVLMVTLVLILGAILVLVLQHSSYLRGMAVPFLVFGLIGAIGSFVVYQRSDNDRIRNVYAYDMNPSQLKMEELPRMKKVMTNFIILRYVEIALVLAGIALFFYFRSNTANAFWKGLGISLAIIAFLGLATDFFAEKRGQVYTTGLITFLSGK